MLDFNITIDGPHHVTVGRFLFFNVIGTVISGSDENVTPSLSGLPPNVVATFPNMAKFCCGTFVWGISGLQPVKIDVGTLAIPGTYPLTITYTSKSGIIKTCPYSLVIVPISINAAPIAFPADVPLAGLVQWEDNMKVYGKLHIKTPPEGPAYEGFAWYYDGTRNYLQIAAYTKDSTFSDYAAILDNLYANYALGGIAAWHTFPKGLAMNFLRTGNAVDKAALLNQLNNNVANFADVKTLISWTASREISYALETHLAAESIGNPRIANFQNVVEVLFGHFDQWFLSKTATFVQPFMVALACEALIEYFDATNDSRVLPTIKMAIDAIWANSWDVASSSFLYYNNDGTTMTSPDLNLLIVPAFGWLFKQTGDESYRQKGDLIFNAGVLGAYLVGGKQFSQNYRLSGKYVEWRASPAKKIGISINGVVSQVSLPIMITIG